MFIHPIQLGSLKLPLNIIYSPLAGCSDYPFRKMVRRYTNALVYCEMVKMEPLTRFDPHTFHLLDYDEMMHPIGAQLCGARVDLAYDAARIVEDLGFDVIDLNCGCPVDKVTKDGSGSALLKTPEKIGRILEEMVRAVSIPVTVKIRAGWDDESINAPLIVKIAEEAGAKAIAVHGRTRVQGYKGLASWDAIKEAKEAASSILVLGNGDVFDAPSAKEKILYSGADGALVSRGSMGQPWIAQDIERFSMGLEKIERTSAFYKQALLDHFDEILTYSDDRKAVLDMRRVSCWYIKSAKGTKEFRSFISKAKDLQEVKELIHRLDFQEDSEAV